MGIRVYEISVRVSESVQVKCELKCMPEVWASEYTGTVWAPKNTKSQCGSQDIRKCELQSIRGHCEFQTDGRCGLKPMQTSDAEP